MSDRNPTLTEALATLEQATKDLGVAAKESSIARNHEIDCLNRVNNAQKTIDSLLAELRQNAPQDSDWRRQARQGQATQP